MVCAATILAGAAVALGRIGENESQCNRRYGGPATDTFSVSQNKAAPLVTGCPTQTYNYHGFRIRIAFIGFNGPAIRMQFTKKEGGPYLKDDEIQAILKGNLPDEMQWQTGIDNWKRSDGVTARLEMMKMGMVLESPAAETLDKRAKDEKEQKRRADIPRF